MKKIYLLICIIIFSLVFVSTAIVSATLAQSCSSQGGTPCMPPNICSQSLIPANDTDYCCPSGATCSPPRIYGDNAKNQESEQCDGTDLVGATCSSILGSSYTGTLSCSLTCGFNTTGCYFQPCIPGTVMWVRQFGTGANERGGEIAIDSTGIYIVGYTFGTLPNQNSAGDGDAFIRKYDADGNVIWTRQFGTSASDGATEIATDSTGIYVAGMSQGALAGPNAGGWDPFVRKYDRDGNVIWTRQFGTSTHDTTESFAIDSTGIYIAGYTFGALAGPNAGVTDVYVRKMNYTNGNEIWTKQFGSSSQEAPNGGIAIDSTGIYVFGHTWGILPGQTRVGSSVDSFVRKMYSTNGDEIWTKQFGTSTDAYSYGGIATDSTGIYVSGSTNGAFPGQTSAGYNDAYTRKMYTINGSEIWTKQFGTSLHDPTGGTVIDSTGIYVVGTTNGAFPGYTNAGSNDVYVRKMNYTNGNEIWTKQFGSSSHDEGIEIAIDSTGTYIYIGGWLMAGAFPGQTSAGGEDIFLAKMCAVAAAAPTCSDSIKNQDETDVDCGGLICSKCINDKNCSVSSDCLSDNCVGGTCMAPAPCTDADADYYVLEATPIRLCCGISGNQACLGGNDCNDTNANVNPGKPETCNGIDDDCDDILDGSESLTQPCGTTDVGACALGTETCTDLGGWTGCTAIGPATETCNGVDDDCDGIIPSNEIDDDKDGMTECEGDCNDDDATIYQGAEELCDGKDNNCGGIIDENFPDTDEDGIADCVDPDDDNDGILDTNDNCALVSNSDQKNTDGDAQGDACDTDDDNDGVVDIEDACPLTHGRTEYQGCLVGDENLVELHVIDKAKTFCNGAGSCKVPVENAEIRVFNRNNADFQAQFTKNPKGTEYPNIFEADTGRVGACMTNNIGKCIAGEEIIGDYLVIIKYTDVETGKIVYTGKPKSPEDFKDTNGDGIADLAYKDFQIIKVINKDKTIDFTAGSKTVITGSVLEVIHPQYVIWENNLTLYPFIFISDSDWTVDVCVYVPEGYAVVDGDCTQVFLASETKDVIFKVVEIGSPEPDMNINIKTKHKGQTKKLSLSVPGKRSKKYMEGRKK